MFDVKPFEHNAVPHMQGDQWRFRFGDIGCSVIRHNYSYGGKEGLFEMAVLVWDADDEWHIADQRTRGWLTLDEINKILHAFQTIQGMK